MKIFEGLVLYEIALLCLGILMFILLLFILMYFVFKKRSVKVLMFLFPFPIIMIAYPSVKSVQFGNGITITKELTAQLKNDPKDKEAKSALVGKLNELQDKYINDPATFLVFANAHAALGDTSMAVNFIDSALALNTEYTPALNFERQTQAPLIRINGDMAKLATNPYDIAAKTELMLNLSKYNRTFGKSANSYMTIAKGHAALGDSLTAIDYADSALKLQPGMLEAVQLKQEMREDDTIY
ncbi:hypothetical protein TRIP_C20017 [Candidatus Zixiibacteriota bacterium]|nr:hypothetical protein TRIP_C20017 [candidate division Zixibacteria bacterium]